MRSDLSRMLVALAALAAAMPAQGGAVQAGADAATVAAASVSEPAQVLDARYLHQGTALPTVGTDDDGVAGLPSAGAGFGVLATGSVACFDQASPAAHCSGSAGAGETQAGRDVTTLAITLVVPDAANHIGLDFVFLSEEWPEFAGSPFSDGFLAELDVPDAALVGAAGAPTNFARDGNGQPVTAATPMQASAATGYDGTTCRLTSWVAEAPGVHTVYLSVHDAGDMIYDSAVAIDGLRTAFHAATPPSACTAGASPAGTNCGLSLAADCVVAGNTVEAGHGTARVSASYEVGIDPSGAPTASAAVSCHLKAGPLHVTPSSCSAGV